jgi:hypothetical protein
VTLKLKADGLRGERLHKLSTKGNVRKFNFMPLFFNGKFLIKNKKIMSMTNFYSEIQALSLPIKFTA